MNKFVVCISLLNFPEPPSEDALVQDCSACKAQIWIAPSSQAIKGHSPICWDCFPDGEEIDEIQMPTGKQKRELERIGLGDQFQHLTEIVKRMPPKELIRYFKKNLT